MKKTQRVHNDLKNLILNLGSSDLIGEFIDSDSDCDCACDQKIQTNNSNESKKIINSKISREELFLFYDSDSDSDSDSESEPYSISNSVSNVTLQDLDSDLDINLDISVDCLNSNDTPKININNFCSLSDKTDCEKKHKKLETQKLIDRKKDMSFSDESGLLLSGSLDKHINNEFDFGVTLSEDVKQKQKNKTGKNKIKSRSNEIKYHNHPIFTAEIMMNVGKLF